MSPGEIDPESPVYLAHWTWSEDHLSCEVELADAEGNPVASGPAEVKVSILDPTCTEAGAKTYKASFIEDGRTYSDTYSEPIAALGHSFDEGTETIVDGNPCIDYECTRCHEHFIITTFTSEDDDPSSLFHHADLEGNIHLHNDGYLNALYWDESSKNRGLLHRLTEENRA